jgi:hypothetical protein
MGKQPVAIFLFEYSTNSAQPWADVGYLCYCVDIQHPAGEQQQGNIIRVGADVRTWRPDIDLLYRCVFVACFPPCTHLAVSGARWFAGKGLRLLAESIELFAVAAEFCEWVGCPYMIENPVSTISTYWRKQDFAFDPCDFAGYLPTEEQGEEAYTKRTCLWVGGGFTMPKPRYVLPLLGSKMHLLPPSEDRANLRSETPKGFALAVFEANNKLNLPSYEHKRRTISTAA